jgi:2-amino-4-hydroxy-6-hydroxymethyldihydropteridine diphosphokinase
VRDLPDGVIVIGFGGNVGGDAAVLDRFARARAALAAWGSVRGSAVVRTAPVGGPAGQPDFLNAAVAVAADSPAPRPRELLAIVVEIERLLGRDRAREVRDGPRPIDLDVLLWGTRIFDADGLVVPHPRLAGRRFALAPILDLLGDELVIPGTERTARELYASLVDQRIEPTAHRI